MTNPMWRYLGLRWGFVFGILCLVIAVQSQSAGAKEASTPLDKADAEKRIEKILKVAGWRDVSIDEEYLRYSAGFLTGYQSETSTTDEMGGNDGGKHHAIPIARIASVSVQPFGRSQKNVKLVLHTADGQLGWIEMRRDDAEKFKVAMEFLSGEVRHAKDADDWAQFKGLAAAWRTASIKPPMPEDARKHKVLAEYAYQQKDLNKAIREYTTALKLFPCWPEGQFNLALLASEQKDFTAAVLHMKEYVELVPDAPDAQAARDKIIIWEDKLNEATKASASSAQPTRK